MVHKNGRLTIWAGPCMAEGYDMLAKTAEHLKCLSLELHFDLVFKASFDKANRSSAEGERGPGMEKGLKWLEQVKNQFELNLVTDVHESYQAELCGSVCDALQIPAFLCRQSDLLEACIKSGAKVNVKKGQFLAPDAMKNIVAKARAYQKKWQRDQELLVTERGACFGYGDLIVDMRSFFSLSQCQVPVLFDITHSTQKPPTGAQNFSGAQRKFAGLLARSALATGYVDGFYLEVHPDPQNAKSDAMAQLNFEQSRALLNQLTEQSKTARESSAIDQLLND